MRRQERRARARADASGRFVATCRVDAADEIEARKARRGIALEWARKQWRKLGGAAVLSGAGARRASDCSASVPSVAEAWTAEATWRASDCAAFGAAVLRGALTLCTPAVVPTRAVISCCAMLVLLTLGVAPGMHAQGSRKDDVVFNAQGRPMGGALVRVCTSVGAGQPCSPLAQIFSDAALSQALANPTAADGLGNYNFYAAPGRYLIEISGPGITTKQMPNVILPSDPSTPTFTSVTTTSGISAFSLSLSGNLTVNGSAAVTGTFTVGGAPVPSVNQDNLWTAGQHFKGPIPYRDVSAYMPAGGCSSSEYEADPPATASITSGSTAVTLSSTSNFTLKNGCGLALLHAGATSTLATPETHCAISSITRAGGVATVTCAAAHGIPVGAGGAGNNPAGMGFTMAGVTDASFNGTYSLYGVPSTTTLQYALAGSATSSGGTMSTTVGYAHGVTGLTTYKYQAVAIGIDDGYSAATPTFIITNGNATLTQHNYNYIGLTAYAPTAGTAFMYGIYSDKGLGGALTCVGTAYTNGYADYGNAYPCPPYLPVNPPVAAGPATLRTTIVSGAGTVNLVVANAASNTATAQSIYHDESGFVTACFADAYNDEAVGSILTGNYGCVIPAGNYYMNGPMLYHGLPASLRLFLQGSVSLQVDPLFVSVGNTQFDGVGGGAQSGQFQHDTTNQIAAGPHVPAGIVIRGNMQNITLRHLEISSYGDAIWMGQTPGVSGPFGINLEGDSLSTYFGFGSPLVISNDTLGLWARNVLYTTNTSTTGMPAIHVTAQGPYGNASCCMHFTDGSSVGHGMMIDMPGGNDTGGGMGVFVFDGLHIAESLPVGDIAWFNHDNGPNLPGAIASGVPMSALTIRDFTSADAVGGPASVALLGEWGSYPYFSGLNLQSVGSFGLLLKCGGNSVACANAASLQGIISFNAPFGGTQGGGLEVTGTEIDMGIPLKLNPAFTELGQTPIAKAWGMMLPPFTSLAVTGTGAGALPAATYCMKAVGIDAQVVTARTAPGYTTPSNEVCQVVGASSSISVSMTQAGNNLQNEYSGGRLYYGTGGPGSEDHYVTMGPPTNDPYTFTFAATGSIGSPPVSNSAYLAWLPWEGSGCIYCSTVNTNSLGVGEPNPAFGDKLAVKGGTLNAESGFKSALGTKSSNYTLAAPDYWINVTGTTTITAAHAIVGQHWVVFNSGAGTVTLQSDVGNMNGAANITLAANTGKEVTCDGTNCFAH